jgi:hypothetical protein
VLLVLGEWELGSGLPGLGWAVALNKKWNPEKFRNKRLDQMLFLTRSNALGRKNAPRGIFFLKKEGKFLQLHDI